MYLRAVRALLLAAAIGAARAEVAETTVPK
jgi:hypothetical protein